MAEDQTKKPAVESKGGPPAIVGILLPALLAAGSAFGGAKLAGGGAPAHGGHEATHVEAPGPTEVLDPFLVMGGGTLGFKGLGRTMLYQFAGMIVVSLVGLPALPVLIASSMIATRA